MQYFDERAKDNKSIVVKKLSPQLYIETSKTLHPESFKLYRTLPYIFKMLKIRKYDIHDMFKNSLNIAKQFDYHWKLINNDEDDLKEEDITTTTHFTTNELINNIKDKKYINYQNKNNVSSLILYLFDMTKKNENIVGNIHTTSQSPNDTLDKNNVDLHSDVNNYSNLLDQKIPFIILYSKENISKYTIQQLIAFIELYKFNNVFIIINNKFTTYGKILVNEFLDNNNNIHIEFCMVDDYLYDMPGHVLNPDMYVVNPVESKLFNQENQLKSEDLPPLDPSCPLLKYYDIKPQDQLFIQRSSESNLHLHIRSL